MHVTVRAEDLDALGLSSSSSYQVSDALNKESLGVFSGFELSSEGVFVLEHPEHHLAKKLLPRISRELTSP